jgi:hypothetical protein
LAVYNEGLLVSPRHSGLHFGRASLYFRQQEFEKSLQDFTAAIAYRPVEERPEVNLLYAHRAFVHCLCSKGFLGDLPAIPSFLKILSHPSAFLPRFLALSN